MDLGIAGKVALVCGASRGIAFAAAEEFAREGCTLVICSRDAASVGRAQAKLEALGAEFEERTWLIWPPRPAWLM